MSDHPSARLATFAAQLRFEDIPEPVVRRAEDLMVDWFGSAVAGQGARAVESACKRAHEAGRYVEEERLARWARNTHHVTDREYAQAEREAAFRVGERRVIARLITEMPVHILATGGGAFMDERTRALTRQRGISVWLRAELEQLLARTARRANRPLLKQGNPREILERLIEMRYPN